MALESRPSSFLPAIKCSTCGQDIDITRLADHICLPSQPLGEDTINVPSSGRANRKGDPAVQSIPMADPAVQLFLDIREQNQQSVQSPGFSQRSGKSAPPKIDAAAANRPFLQADALTPLSDYSNYSDGQGLTPITPNTQITTPSSMFSRKPSYPRSPSPPSPNFAVNLDSAFPPFRSVYDAPVEVYKPNLMKPMASPGANVLRRMNTITDGPFSQRNQIPPALLRERRPSNDWYGQQSHEATSREPHGKDSKSQAPDSKQSPPRDGQSHARKISQEKTKRVVDSIDLFLQDMDADDEPAPMLNRESRSRTFPEKAESQPRYDPAQYFRPLVSAAHNRTDFFPDARAEDSTRPSTSAGPRNQPRGRFDAFKDPAIQNPFIPSSRQRPHEEEQTQSRPRAVTNANSPDKDIQSPWFEAPRPTPVPPTIANRSPPRASSQSSNQSRSRSRTIARENVDRYADEHPGPPSHPILALMRQENPSRNDVSHSPSESSSSSLYAPSLPSTAPTSVASISRSGSAESYSSSRSRGLSRPQKPDALPPPMIPYAKVPQPFESPIDPAIHLVQPPSDPAIQMGAIGPGRSYISNSPPRPRQNPTNSPTISSKPPAALHAPISKGKCRGCTTDIYGKSVKAADGRLTGRYHKECFVCKDCAAPFLTAEFYVLENAPYCHAHYHERNGSMCAKCNRGIEGEYRETDRRERYHAGCFCCEHCRGRLDEEYFEVGGRPFCERHAFAMGRRRGGGAPVVAERRRTRLMFM